MPASLHNQGLHDLIIGRNQQRKETLRPELAQTPRFVAVGALHLPGEYGVLRLLEKAGFSVERLSMKQP